MYFIIEEITNSKEKDNNIYFLYKRRGLVIDPPKTYEIASRKGRYERYVFILYYVL